MAEPTKPGVTFTLPPGWEFIPVAGEIGIASREPAEHLAVGALKEAARRILARGRPMIGFRDLKPADSVVVTGASCDPSGSYTALRGDVAVVTPVGEDGHAYLKVLPWDGEGGSGPVWFRDDGVEGILVIRRAE